MPDEPKQKPTFENIERELGMDKMSQKKIQGVITTYTYNVLITI